MDKRKKVADEAIIFTFMRHEAHKSSMENYKSLCFFKIKNHFTNLMSW